MDMFVTDDEVAHCQLQLATLSDQARLPTLVWLAWHLRQRDTRRALTLADEAHLLISQAPPAPAGKTEQALLSARLNLVLAEAKWLFSELNPAQEIATSALHEFERSGDTEGHQGSADAHFLLAWVALHRGEMALVESEIGLAMTSAKLAQDPTREFVSQTFLAVQKALQNLPLALQRFGSLYPPDTSNLTPVLAGCIYEFFTYTSSLSSDFGKSAASAMQLYEFALQTGQIRRAISAASNVGDAFNSLNDHQAALQWMQLSYDLARRTGWPSSIGACQTQMAETLRRLGRLDAASNYWKTRFRYSLRWWGRVRIWWPCVVWAISRSIAPNTPRH